MILCQRLLPVSLLLSSCLISALLAGTQSASAGANNDGGIVSKQQSVEDSQRIHSTDDQSLDKRAAPRFVGKRLQSGDSPLDLQDQPDDAQLAAADQAVDARQVLRWVGKYKGKNRAGAPADEHRLEKRAAPRFVGKRFGYYRRSSKEPSTPYLSTKEFINTYRKSDPYFMGKRAPDYDDSEEAFTDLEERGAPRFVGKRGPPRFVGKRGPPRFVGKRQAPRFVGKRQAPRFVGKRDQDELESALDNYDLGEEIGEREEAYQALLSLLQLRRAEEEAARRQEARDLIQARFDQFQAERAAAAAESHPDGEASEENDKRR